jgi:isocitrate/isopropylmalate dehydrogenase
MQLFANLRPVTCHPKLLNASPCGPRCSRTWILLVVRELTGGLYFGEKKRGGQRQRPAAPTPATRSAAW